MILMDGKALAAKKKSELRAKVDKLPRRPGLGVILIGDDPASRTYVNGKRRDCEECGFYSEEYTLPADAAQEQAAALVEELNGREDIDGILVQLPLPGHLDAQALIAAIRPDKDVDGLHPINLGKLLMGDPSGFTPCTPLGIMEILKEYEVPVAGKSCVVLGRSNIVGKPMAALLTAADGTVTSCHSKTVNIAEKSTTADILVSAVGKRNFLTGDMVKPGAVVIDVAINRDEEGKLHGDSDDTVAEKTSYFTPVPGGVGPMTRAGLMLNTYKATCRHLNVDPA